MRQESKFKVGQKVYYTPKLTGFNNKTPLIIEYVNFKETDEFSEAFGVKFTPTFMYHFKDTNLGASEKDLIS